jgi:hypothetical protein
LCGDSDFTFAWLLSLRLAGFVDCLPVIAVA